MLSDWNPEPRSGRESCQAKWGSRWLCLCLGFVLWKLWGFSPVSLFTNLRGPHRVETPEVLEVGEEVCRGHSAEDLTPQFVALRVLFLLLLEAGVGGGGGRAASE